MAVIGNLKEFSLPELFQFLHQGRKTGLLVIRTESAITDFGPAGQRQIHGKKLYYIWVERGGIVAFAEKPHAIDLSRAIAQRGWLKKETIAEAVRCRPADIPLGLLLKQQGCLQAEQLKLLFHAQVMRPVCALFRLNNGQFKFHPEAPIPKVEMTGLHLAADQATLLGLRVLRDWSMLSDKLPAPSSVLSRSKSVPKGKPPLNLDSLEWQIWEFVTGTVCVEKIAHQLRLSVQQVQEVAFRLISVGLVDEIPVSVQTPDDSLKFTPPDSSEQFLGEAGVAAQSVKQSHPVNDREKPKLSTSFMNCLVGFLKSQV